MSPNEVAELLMVSPVTVRQWAQKGWIKCELTAGGHRRYLLPDVERFASERGLVLKFPVSEKLRILIVDDNQELAEYLFLQLQTQDEPMEIRMAHDGFEAGRRIEVFKPNIVLLDLMMPGLDGFEVCRRLKASSETQSIRILAMTGYPSEENVQRILSEGAEVCLAKPFKAQELYEAIGLVSTKSSVQ